MRIKIIILVMALIIIILIAIFGSDIKQELLIKLSTKIPQYNCKGNLCTSCIIEGNTCNCGNNLCSCGNRTVNRTECEL